VSVVAEGAVSDVVHRPASASPLMAGFFNGDSPSVLTLVLEPFGTAARYAALSSRCDSLASRVMI
jgi:hypothetical protein